MLEIKDTDDFNTYLGMNPRKPIPNQEMRNFLEYAKSRYEDLGVVNFTHLEDNREDIADEVEHYVGESMEILLLYKEWLKERENHSHKEA